MSRLRTPIGLAAVMSILAGVGAGAAEDPTAAHVVERLQQARVEAGVARLDRRAELDRIAQLRATAVAALDHSDRLNYAEPVGDQLRAEGVRWFSSAAAHLDMVRGYTRPEIGLLGSWQRYDMAWTKALGADFTSLGAATARGADGWVVFVAVLVADLPYPEDPAELERAVVQAVNRVRAEHGLGTLTARAALGAVARGHSADMAARDFVGHVNPDGLGTAERVELAGIAFNELGENVHMNRGARDPVSFAVERWLNSPGHRDAMLHPAYVETGVGAAMADDGRIFLTQLFLVPAAER